MDTVKGVLIILVLLLSATTFLFFIQYTGYKSQATDAAGLGITTLDFLRAQGIPCHATSIQFKDISGCIAPYLKAKDFKEDSFGQPDPKQGTSGYLVIKNINHNTYAASNFTFYFDREVLQEGCTIQGSIDYGVTCRFNFDKKCDKGDVLEVNYEKIKIFTKTC